MRGRSSARRGFFDGVADEWEGRGFPPEEIPKVERLKERLGSLRGLTVFEPGCGAGRLTALLMCWVGPEGRVIAVDNSIEMAALAGQAVEAARSDLGDAAAPAELHCRCAEDLPVPEKSVDLALLFCVFPHFDDQPAALACFRRMLRPGGRLVISHLEGSERLNAFHRDAGEAVARDRIPPREDLDGMIQGAGLEVAEWVDVDEEFYLEARRPEDRGVSRCR